MSSVYRIKREKLLVSSNPPPPPPKSKSAAKAEAKARARAIAIAEEEARAKSKALANQFFLQKNDITVILAGIRDDKWFELYSSIVSSTKRKFEIIFIGPNFPSKNLRRMPNVKFFRDFGSPSRCRQIGLQFATGTYTIWASDDAPFLPGAIDNMFDMLSKMGSSEKNIVSGKYYEGRHIQGSDELHLFDPYYYLNYHNATRSPYFPDSWLILNMGIINTNYLKSLGGWDCSFEATTAGDADLAARVQRDGAKVVLTRECIASVGWSAGEEGDHGPVHNACVENDFPLFQSIYSNPNCVNRIKIPMDNWVGIPSYWERRFKTN